MRRVLFEAIVGPRRVPTKLRCIQLILPPIMKLVARILLWRAGSALASVHLVIPSLISGALPSNTTLEQALADSLKLL